MKIGILGTGMVGSTLGTKLVALGHEVKIGGRQANNEAATEWVSSTGRVASQGTFADAAAYGEMIFSCLRGDIALAAIKSAGPQNFKGKIIVDVSNPLDLSAGMPPPLLKNLVNTNSLGEEVQKLLPDAFVVKAFNTMNCEVMVNPSIVGGESDVFLCGNDAKAKAKVIELLRSFGWKNFVDVGDITCARGTEMLLPLWMRLWSAFGHTRFNFKIVK